MSKWHVWESRAAVAYQSHTVDAESEEEAIRKYEEARDGGDADNWEWDFDYGGRTGEYLVAGPALEDVMMKSDKVGKERSAIGKLNRLLIIAHSGLSYATRNRRIMHDTDADEGDPELGMDVYDAEAAWRGVVTGLEMALWEVGGAVRGTGDPKTNLKLHIEELRKVREKVKGEKR